QLPPPPTQTQLLTNTPKKETPDDFNIAVLRAIFSVVYILLLPMGGYRDYRPFILRRDTILPVLVLMYFCWGASSVLLIKLFKGLVKRIYICFLIGISFFYMKKDTVPTYTNTCEKEYLQELAIKSKGPEKCIKLKRDCTVINWGFTDSCEQSELLGSMLYYWHITSRNIEFCQPEEEKK
ncbi:MAG: hypothetical protein ACTHJT_12095, partial [Cytophaga sp.]|uniref:hypothetical protein n=1 Tax=Cytophaga sp. TaxID=29535 RepID=UPI003F7D5CBA